MSADVLAAVLDTMDIGVSLLDAGGVVIMTNGPFVRATGLGVEAGGRPLWERLDAPQLREALQRALAGETVEVSLGAEPGPVWWGRARKVASGLLILTERPGLSAPDELEAMSNALEPLPIGLALMEDSPEGAVLLGYNARYAEMMGFAPHSGSVYSALPFRVYRPDRATLLPQSELPGPTTARTGQRLHDQELHLLRADGSWRVLSVSAMPRPGKIPGRMRAMAYLLDITERYEAEREVFRGYALYRAVAGHIRDLLVLISPVREGGEIVDWVVRDVNDTLLAEIGLERRQMIGVPARTILPDNTRRIEAHWREVLATGEPYNYEIEHGPSSYLVRAFRVDEDTIGSASIDITERKEAEARVRAEQQRLREAEDAMRRSRAELLELIERVPFGVFVTREERIVYANPTFAGYVSADRAELVGSRLEELLVPLEPQPLDPLAPLGRRGRSDRKPWRVQRQGAHGGPPTILEISETRHIELEGHPATLWTALDLTELVETQARLVQSDRLAAVGTLAAAVADEINNPLAYVMAALDFVHESLQRRLEPDHEVSMALAEAREGAARVEHVVRDLKRISRGGEGELLEGGKRPSGPPVDLRSILESAIHLAANEIRHRAKLSLEIGQLPPIVADEPAIGQVFLNLLLNAAQAIEPGSDRAEIRVVAGTTAQGLALVEVHDTGAGIDPEHLPHIFDAFFTTKPVGVGTGLGLWICRNTVERHGGELTVQSQRHVGSVFRVVLPAAQGAPAPAPAPRWEQQGPARARGRVLVVDDEATIGSALRRMLGRQHDVITLTSGRAARELLASGARFEVILCDVMMREMNGVELWEEIARLCPEQAARVVFISGGAFTAEAERFLKTTANPCLDKPFDIRAVQAVVDRLVGSAWGSLAPGEP